jgi:hypothetical protein
LIKSIDALSVVKGILKRYCCGFRALVRFGCMLGGISTLQCIAATELDRLWIPPSYGDHAMHEVIASVGFSLEALRAVRASFTHGRRARLLSRCSGLAHPGMTLSSELIEHGPLGGRAEC